MVLRPGVADNVADLGTSFFPNWLYMHFFALLGCFITQFFSDALKFELYFFLR
jgi:hypothetical protein